MTFFIANKLIVKKKDGFYVCEMLFTRLNINTHNPIEFAISD